ncbi:rhomboid-domain-containing protein [Ascobolus immersus RN42]|uniref:Rhomboid-domain-containing protein n=1 Tax=Ascobolus immersus RN42 TaxID=1160509 RepID=A0A3N4HP05_ASCIM|nr:rhomboid-domain-containing protein [Ascobolus immersus RN42]
MAPPLFPTAGRLFSKASRLSDSLTCTRSFSSTPATLSPAFILPTITTSAPPHARSFQLGGTPDNKPKVTPPLVPNITPNPKPTLLASILLKKPQFHNTPSLLWSKLFRLGQQGQSPPPSTTKATSTPQNPELLEASRRPHSPPPSPSVGNGPPPPEISYQPPPPDDPVPPPPPPPHNPWANLLKPTLFAIASTIACIAYGLNYRPPPNDKRWFPHVSPEFATVAALIGVNVAIFLLWQRPIGGVAGWKWMNRYLASIPGRPEWLSLLGSCFSHLRFIHLAVNCYGLYVFGIQLCAELNRGNFLALYFSSGILSALFSMYWNVYKARWNVFSIGASGAIMGLISTYAYCFPDATFYIMLLPFVSFKAWDMVLGLGCIEVIGLWRGWMRMDHMAHLGGLVVGYVWAKTYLGEVVRKRREGVRRWFGNRG